MGSQRAQKISRLLQKELGDIFQKNRVEWFGGIMITVTEVRVTPDFSLAKVYLSVFQVDDKERFIKELKSYENKVRYELGGRIRNQLRKVPEIIFYLDDSLDQLENIERLLRE